MEEKKDMKQKRTTSEFVVELQSNGIFVFGSIRKGIHGDGAATIVYRKSGTVIENIIKPS